MEINMQILQKLKIAISFGSASPLVGPIPERPKDINSSDNMHTRVYRSSLQ